MDKPGKDVLSRKQIMKQIKMLYDLVVETRQVLMEVTQRHEQSKIRQVSEWETLVQVLGKECGVLEEDMNRMLGENFTRNVDKYNQMLQERVKQFEEQAEEQAQEVTAEAEKYIKENGLDLEVEDGPQEEVLAVEARS